jgi:hypothetical protein
MAQTRRLTSSAALLALALVGLTACSPGEEAPASSATSTPTESATTTSPSPSLESPSVEPSETATPTETATETAAPTEPPADELTLPADAVFSSEPQSTDPWPDSSRGGTYPTAVRAAAQNGFDRVVMEFAGPDAPSYRASYVDEASFEGSGDPIDVAGTVFLRVDMAIVLSPSDREEDNSLMFTGPVATGDAAVSGIYAEGPFEGYSVLHIGLDGARDFRVSTLTDPARIVVDIKR